jgi:hypothetical protein
MLMTRLRSYRRRGQRAYRQCRRCGPEANVADIDAGSPTVLPTSPMPAMLRVRRPAKDPVPPRTLPMLPTSMSPTTIYRRD